MSNARKIASSTSHAYSYERYGAGEWEKAAQMLLDKGFTEYETAWVLESKWMRWAADGGDAEYGAATARMLGAFLEDPRNKATRSKVALYVRGAL